VRLKFSLLHLRKSLSPNEGGGASTLIKKKIKFSSYIRKFCMEQLQSHIWLTASYIWGNIFTFPHILGSPSSYMTLQLLHSEFFFLLYIRGKFYFIFYQCGNVTKESEARLSRES
jgi:hypothetical protein